MANLYGNKYSKDQLLELVGDISQIAYARHSKLVGGYKDGTDIIEFKTGSGLSFTVVPGRAMDISSADFNGKSLAWRSGAGEVNASYYDERGIEWLRSFTGGLVTTCGLTYLGAPGEDDGNSLGLHGRISNIPAENININTWWDGDDYFLSVSGKMNEFRVFGDNMLMKRTITAKLGESKIWIEDEVTNQSPRTTPHMLLYHINGGFPAVAPGSRLISPSIRAIPKDSNAEIDSEHYFLNDPPTKDFTERIYWHEMKSDEDGFVSAALVNEEMPDGIPFGFYVKYNIKELPNFVHWKQNGTQEYVVGLEPSNCWTLGRAAEKERETLQYMEPGEVRKYHLEFGVVSSKKDVDDIEDLVKK